MKEFLEREAERSNKNKAKNRPIVFMTYIMVITFMALFGYVIYFMMLTELLLILIIKGRAASISSLQEVRLSVAMMLFLQKLRLTMKEMIRDITLMEVCLLIL